jgi:small subunit ribosomal protein S20
LAHSQRGWTGARTPSAIKRVRQTERRRAINQPRRTAAKTLIGKAMLAANDAATNGGSQDEVREAVERAVSALDRAAKLGAIHRNAADRRKSRLMLKVNAALGGETVTSTAKSVRQTSKAAAAKEAKARIAAGRATKAKGAQTAAGKARAALARTSRDASTDQAAGADSETATTATKTAAKPASRSSAKSSTAKSSTAKTATKSTASKTSAAKTAKKS